METMTLFGYTCPECGKGMVQPTRFHNYKTKIKGYPFTVHQAIIGVCNNCGAKHFAAQETKRWENLFYSSLEEKRAILSPSEIVEIRESLGLSMEDFARLIGCTRQSIYNWEKFDRTASPSRMADLLMKLVKKSYDVGQVDAISFLLDEAKKWGVAIEIQQSLASQYKDSFVLYPKVRESSIQYRSNTRSLAADTESGDEEVDLVTSTGETVGTLRYDYGRAALILDVSGTLPPWDVADIGVKTRNNKISVRKSIPLPQSTIVLQEKTIYTEKDVLSVIFNPQHNDA